MAQIGQYYNTIPNINAEQPEASMEALTSQHDKIMQLAMQKVSFMPWHRAQQWHKPPHTDPSQPWTWSIMYLMSRGGATRWKQNNKVPLSFAYRM